MSEEEIGKSAANGIFPDGKMDIADRCLFFEVKDVYRRYKDGEISREDGERLKKEAVKRYREEKKKIEYVDRTYKFHSRMWVEVEGAANNYMTNPSIENADVFVRAVYGAGRKEGLIVG